MDTSVLVAGIAGFKDRAATNPSAVLLREWVESGAFTWLVTEEILSEYKAVLARLRVRRKCDWRIDQPAAGTFTNYP